ncbi:MAG: hypothetical protein Q9195_008314 [Heterodermia aff. obscurata]
MQLKYHEAALSSHPDKVPEDERTTAEIKFKAVGQAYDILNDDDKRYLYDTHGMSAFEGPQGAGMGASVDLEEMLSQMFGMGGGMEGMGEGIPPGSGGVPRPRKARKGANDEQTYNVLLDELYKGKTAKFSSRKNIICSHCKGTGGKEKAKSKQCASCQGRGSKQGLRSVGPGLVAQETVLCSVCRGTGSIFKDKDRCKKCKGNRVVEARKVLELYIPRGSRDGDKIVLEGEADQEPDQEPGDIVFTLDEAQHDIFHREGADLSAEIEVTLAEALCGFSRVVLKHLDGRGIHVKHPQPIARVLKPGQVLKVAGEGMPLKKSDAKGDLYLVVKVSFPEQDWLEQHQAIPRLLEILPKPAEPIKADIIDEVEYDETASLDGFGGNDQDGGAWEDEDVDDGAEAHCAQQ